jgi:hypothetical protein
MATATGRDLAGVDGIRINGHDFGFSNPQSFDNLIIGTSITDIDAIPEPSTALLSGLAMLAILRRKR